MRRGAGFFLASALWTATPANAAAPTPIVIATGPVASFAFPLGGEICRLYEQGAPDMARCSVEATDGSVENLNRLRAGEIPFAIVQSDLAADAVTGSGAFAGKTPFAELRSVIGFYAEGLTLLVRSDGTVKQVDDLKGKRVAVGEPGAPDPLFADFLEGLGWSKADLGGIVEMPRGGQIAALCKGRVAAIAVTAPHPNGFVREALAACGLTPLELAGPGIDEAVAAHRAYAPMRIDMRAYGASRSVQSFGPRAVLVTTAKLPDETVTRLLAPIFDHLDQLSRAHPAFAGLDRRTVADGAGLGVERHPAAAKFLADRKLVEPAQE